MLIDTHCHLNLIVKEKFDTLLTEEELARAKPFIEHAHSNKVSTIINVGTSYTESINSITISKTYKNVFATIGIHPNDWTTESDYQLTLLAASLQDESIKSKIVGIGETGIDLYRSAQTITEQKSLFEAHILLAIRYKKALIVHSRHAAKETLELLNAYKNQLSKIVIHCFSYDYATAKYIADNGWYMGIDGPITYKSNHELHRIVREIPLDHFVLETDSPFLPVAHKRGTKNEPFYLADIAYAVGQLTNTPVEHIAAKTSANACALFDLPPLV